MSTAESKSNGANKVDGLSYDVLAKALEQARQGRLHILGKMLETIPEPRADYKDFVPRIEQIKIPKDFIGAVIGCCGCEHRCK